MRNKVDFLESYIQYLINPSAVSTDMFTLYFGIHFVLLSILFVYMYKKIRHARRLLDTPTSKIRSAAQGFVEIKAYSKNIAPMISPLTGTPCCWWRYKVEKISSSGSNKHWQTINEGESTVGFIIYDETGECMVHPEGADVYPHRQRKWYGHTAKPDNRSLSQIGLNKDYKYSEELLFEGLPLFAQGMFYTFRPNAHLTGPDQGDIINEWIKDHKRLLKKYDENGNKILDPQEWQRVLFDVEQEFFSRQKKFKENNPKSVNILSEQGLPKNLNFILSGKSEKELYKHKKIMSFVYFIGFLILITHAIYALI